MLKIRFSDASSYCSVRHTQYIYMYWVKLLFTWVNAMQSPNNTSNSFTFHLFAVSHFLGRLTFVEESSRKIDACERILKFWKPLILECSRTEWMVLQSEQRTRCLCNKKHDYSFEESLVNKIDKNIRKSKGKQKLFCVICVWNRKVLCVGWHDIYVSKFNCITYTNAHKPSHAKMYRVCSSALNVWVGVQPLYGMYCIGWTFTPLCLFGCLC